MLYTSQLIMGKKKGGKWSPPEHFTGFKQKFIESYVPTFLQYPSESAQGEFYTMFTNVFCWKYGNSLTGITMDLAEDAPDPTIFGEDNEVSAEAANVQSENFKKIQKVSSYTNMLYWKLTGYTRNLPNYSTTSGVQKVAVHALQWICLPP